MEETNNKELDLYKAANKRLTDDNALLARKCARLALDAELNKAIVDEASNNMKMANHAEALAIKLEHQITINERIKNKITNVILDAEEEVGEDIVVLFLVKLVLVTLFLVVVLFVVLVVVDVFLFRLSFRQFFAKLSHFFHSRKLVSLAVDE